MYLSPICTSAYEGRVFTYGSPRTANEPYAIAKISAIKLCRCYNEQYGTNFISAMPTNLYGPGDNFNLETAHVLPALIRKFHLAKLLRHKQYDDIKKDLQKRPIGFNINAKTDIDQILKKIGITPEYVVLWGSGEPYREFLYVDDLASACIFLMERHDSGDVEEFVNIGTGKDIKIKILAEIIKNIVGFEGTIKLDTSKPDGMPKKLLDTSRINALDWKPKITLKEGIARTYEWFIM